MARRGATKSSLKGIVAHEKALTACKGNITRLRLLRHAVSNNGEAAQLVSGSEAYKNCGALAPISAAKKFKLRVLDSNFEDKPSVTTFALLAPLEKREVIGTRNRMIVVFRIDDKPGALFDALSVFKTLGINMKQIHSVFTGQGQYDFYIELDVPKEKVDLANAASMRLQVVTTRMLSFGPFELFD
jgi:prephenate dehydratase